MTREMRTYPRTRKTTDRKPYASNKGEKKERERISSGRENKNVCVSDRFQEGEAEEGWEIVNNRVRNNFDSFIIWHSAV